MARYRSGDTSVAAVSEGLGLRNLTAGLGGAVTGAFGGVVRAALEDRYFWCTRAERVVRRTDDRGPGLTGAMRERVVGAAGE